MAIMARMDSSHPEAVSRHPKAQKWLPSNFFDLWLSIDTKNSTLWAIVLAKLAVERPWCKMKIFMQKYVKIEIFLIHESYYWEIERRETLNRFSSGLYKNLNWWFSRFPRVTAFECLSTVVAAFTFLGSPPLNVSAAAAGKFKFLFWVE